MLLHYWLEEPIVVGVPNPGNPEVIYNRVLESDKTATAIVTREIPYDASFWVLLFGAAFGGLLSRFVQGVTGRNRPSTNLVSAGRFQRFKTFVFELFAAVLLPVVVTILVARLSSTDAPIGLRVRDIWGAVAMGFVVQWLGIAWFNRLIPGGSDQEAGSERMQPETPQDEDLRDDTVRVGSLPSEPSTTEASQSHEVPPASSTATSDLVTTSRGAASSPTAPRDTINGT